MSRFSSIHRLILRSAPYAGLADRFREAMGGFPPWLVVMIISMLPIFELRGGIPAGAALGMPVWKAAVFAVIGNMIPIPFILWFLEPLSGWLSRHFDGNRLPGTVAPSRPKPNDPRPVQDRPEETADRPPPPTGGDGLLLLMPAWSMRTSQRLCCRERGSRSEPFVHRPRKSQ